MSHDQTMFNTCTAGTLDLCNCGHSFLALRNCSKSTVCDLYQVLLLLGLIHTPEILFTLSYILVNGLHFSVNPVGGGSIHHQLITSAGTLVMSHGPAKDVEQLL